MFEKKKKGMCSRMFYFSRKCFKALPGHFKSLTIKIFTTALP